MSNYSILLLSTILVPLVIAIVLLAAGRLPKNVTQFLATVGFFFPALGGLILWRGFRPTDSSGYDYLTSLPTGLEGLGITLKLGLNGISMPLFFMAGVVRLAAGIYAIQSSAKETTVPYAHPVSAGWFDGCLRVSRCVLLLLFP